MNKKMLMVLLLIGLAACSPGAEPSEVDCSQLDSYRVPASQLMDNFIDYGNRLDLEDPGSRSVAEQSIQGLLEKARALPCADQHPEKQADLEGAILKLQEAVEYAKRGDQIDVFRSMEKVKAHIHSFNDWSGMDD
jgi:hypothetical protein